MAGIYVHIPFCKQACTYCDFHFSTTFEKYREELIHAINQELISRKFFLENQIIDSIYFGGGTPSLLDDSELNQIITTINENYSLSSSTEVTLEANPDDITALKLAQWRKEGVNRLSIGVQSFNDKDLIWMNRAHRSVEALKAIQEAKKYGFLLTLDLMYGLPNSTLKNWEENVQTVVDLAPEHISAYCLTIEEKTVLHQWVKKDKIQIPDDEIQAEQFNKLVDLLEYHGYEQYEISNFAKMKQYAIHNSNYWKDIPYLGVGPSAHSYNRTMRTWNISNNSKYIQAIREKNEYFELEEITPNIHFNEVLLTGLRTKWGVELNYLKSILPLEKDFLNQIKKLKSKKLVIDKEGVITLTQNGKLLADQIISDLMVV